jgi:hypothetical protein
LTTEKRFTDPRKEVTDLYARLIDAIRYLSLAHGAALGVSVSVLKDLRDTALSRGVGHVTGLFAIGFAVAVVSYVIIIMHREMTLGSYNSKTVHIEKIQKAHENILIAVMVLVAISTFILMLALILVACNVWSL